MVTRFTNHRNRDLCQIALLGFSVLWTGSKNTQVLLTKICTLNFMCYCIIVAFAIIYIYKCFNFSSLLIVSTHLEITWPNDIVWLTLTIFFLPVAIVKRRSNQHMLWNQITIVPVLNILDSFQACNLWTRIACICFNQILSNGWWYITWIAAWM